MTESNRTSVVVNKTVEIRSPAPVEIQLIRKNEKYSLLRCPSHPFVPRLKMEKSKKHKCHTEHSLSNINDRLLSRKKMIFSVVIYPFVPKLKLEKKV